MADPDRFCPDPGLYRPAHRTPPLAPAGTPDRITDRTTAEGCLPGDGCEVDVYDVLDQADYEIFVAERDGTDHYPDGPEAFDEEEP